MHKINRPVYVLGAGFCCDFQPGAFPLAVNFLKVAKVQNVYRTGDVHRSLSMFITKYFGDDTSPDIERVLSFLAASPFDEQSAIREDKASLYDQLVLIIAGTLTAVSASVAGRANHAMRTRFGARFPGDYVWDLYSRFAKDLIDRHAVIVTFNYDLLIEFLLRSTGSWGMHDGYGIEIPLIDEALPPQLRRQNTSQSNSSKPSLCTLLKLHGSINWGVPISGNRSISAEEVWQRVAAASTIYRLPDDGKYGLLNFQTFEHPETQLPIAFRPLVVPPVLDKSAWLKGSSLHALWGEAEKAVQTSEEITFIGYSLPPTDFLAEFMFRQGYRSAPNKQITVVAPDANQLVTNRLRSVFGGSIQAVSKSFKDWAADKYFPSRE
jgi:hypothetical protein